MPCDFMSHFQVRGQNHHHHEEDPTEARPPPGVIQTNPRFYKNPFKRPDGAGREGAVDLDRLFPEGTFVGRCVIHPPTTEMIRQEELRGQVFKVGFVHVAECLINEDCPDTDYCDPNTRSCTDACNLNGAKL